MSPTNRLIIEPLDRHHDRGEFFCGEAALDRYVKQQATQDIRRRIARVFVAVSETAPTRILGFYTLSALSIAAVDLSPGMARKLPRHPLPAALIGRLAVDASARGMGVGTMLVMDALRRAIAVSGDIAVFAAVVDAQDERARQFYESLGFMPFPDTPLRLFLPLASVRE